MAFNYQALPFDNYKLIYTMHSQLGFHRCLSIANWQIVNLFNVKHRIAFWPFHKDGII